MAGEARGIKSIEVGGRLLVELSTSAEPLMLRDLAERTDLAPAQAHAYLSSYRRVGLVVQDSDAGKYAIGPFAMRMGMAYLDSNSLLAEAARRVTALADEHELMGVMAVWGPLGVIAVHVHDAMATTNLNIRQGTTFSLTGTATGRVFAAYSAAPPLRACIEAELSGEKRNGVGAIVDRASFEASVARIKVDGHGLSIENPIPGISAVSVPVCDEDNQLVAALTLIGPANILSLGPGCPHIERLKAAASGIRAVEPPARARRVIVVQGQPPAGRPKSEGRGVQSVEVGARLLNALVEERHPMMLKDLAQQAGIAPAQAHAYLVSFRNLGLVEREGQGGRYCLGPFALQLGMARMRGLDRFGMANAAARRLRDETELTVALAVIGSFGPTVIELHESSTEIHMNTREGSVYSVTGTATGRVFAAFGRDTVIRELMKAEARNDTSGRRVGKPQFMSRAEIEMIRQRGFATIEKQPVPGINAASAPVFDHAGQMELAMTLIGPETVFTVSEQSEYVQKLLAATRELSMNLGYDGYHLVAAAKSG